MKKSMSVIVAALALWSVPSAAQKSGLHGMGNGGDAIVCYDDSTRQVIRSVNLFDHWEKQRVFQYPGGISLGGPNVSVADKITLASERIRKFDPELADKIKVVALSLLKNIADYTVTGYQLPEIDDATPETLPTIPNCFVEQFAVQYKDVVTGQRRFYIANKFYNFPGTSNDDKAGLLLHEAIYRYAILKGVTNSDGVRLFNYWISTIKLDGLGPHQLPDYLGILSLSGLSVNECRVRNGFLLKPDPKNGREFYSCYNQVVNLSPTVTLAMPYGIEYTEVAGDYYDYELVHLKGNKDLANNFYTVTFIENAKAKVLLTSKLKVKRAESIYFMDLKPYDATLAIRGPLSKDYECKPNGIHFNLVTSSVTACDPQASVIFNFLNRLNAGTWYFENGYYDLEAAPFGVTGSTKNLKIRQEVYGRGYLNAQMQLPFGEGRVDQIRVDGIDYAMSGFFVVAENGGQPKLTFQAHKEMYGLRKNNLPLVDSSGDDAVTALATCKLYGYDATDLPRLAEEVRLLSGKPAQMYTGMANQIFKESSYVTTNKKFYDVNLKTVVEKVDEDVNVITRANCFGVVSTMDY